MSANPRTASSSYSISAELSRATMRQNRQSVTTVSWPRAGDCYNSDSPQPRKETRESMVTCPKCKLTIHRNGNHQKLGSTWHHEQCPARPAATKQASTTE